MKISIEGAFGSAIIAHNEDRIEEAINLYTEILEINPDHPDVNHNLGVILRGRDSLEQALPLFKKALDVRPDVEQFWISYITSLIDLGDSSKVQSSLKKAKKRGVRKEVLNELRLKISSKKWSQTYIASQNPPVDQVQIAINFSTQGHFEKALGHARKLLQTFPDSAVLFNLIGAQHSKLEQLDEAIAAYKRAVEIEPSFAVAHVNMANMLKDKGELDDAIASYRRALELKPDCPGTISNLASILVQKGETKNALHNFSMCHDLKRGNRPIDPSHKSFEAISKVKISHDIDQFEYLAAAGIESKKFSSLAALYRRVSSEISWTSDTEVFALNPAHRALLKDSYNRCNNLVEAPVLSGPVLGCGLDFKNITRNYYSHEHGLVYFDNFLNPKALKSLRDFLLGSTIWYDLFHPGGYLGAYLDDGLASPLLLQIAEEMRNSLPDIFMDHPLKQLWAYKYDSRARMSDSSLAGIRAHADAAAVNVNFWITPAIANLDNKSGGLVVYNESAPLHWGFEDFNGSTSRLPAYLESRKENRLVVPYNENRIVLFNSNLIHETDKYYFDEGYENKRINITMLFGKRG